jgi:hypothetical protein
VVFDASTLGRLLDDLRRAHLEGAQQDAYVAMSRALGELVAATTLEAARDALAKLSRAAHVTPTGEIDLFIEPENVFQKAVLAFCEDERARLDAARGALG